MKVKGSMNEKAVKIKKKTWKPCQRESDYKTSKPRKASLDTTDAINFTGGICRRVYIKYEVYRKWFKELIIIVGPAWEATENFFVP